MSTLPSRGLLFVLVTGGLTLAGACAANAAETDGTHSIGGGNQIQPSVTVPVTIEGNSIAILGDASSAGTAAPASGAPGSSGPGTATRTDGTGSVLGGNQIAPDLTAPITADGNAIALLGDATANDSAPAGNGTGSSSGAGDLETDGSHSVLGGNQIAPDVTAPITAGGNAIAVLGDAATDGTAPAATPTGSADHGELVTDGSNSIGGGNQIAPVLWAPVTVGGNAIALLGDAATDGTAPAATPTGSADHGELTTDGSNSIGGGNQVAPILRAPVTVAGNQVSLVSDRWTADLWKGLSHVFWPALAVLSPEHLLRLTPLVGDGLPLVVGGVDVEVTVGGSTADTPSVGHPAPAPGAEDPHGEAPTPGTTDGSSDPWTQPVLPAVPGAGSWYPRGTAAADDACRQMSLVNRSEVRTGSSASRAADGVGGNETCAASIDLTAATDASPGRLDATTAGLLALAVALTLGATGMTVRRRAS